MANTPNDNVVFIRAGVACGKSTLIRYMVENFPEEFVELQPSADDIGWYHNIIEAAGYNDGVLHLPEVEGIAYNAAVKALKQIARANKTIVIDEAHRLFSSANVNDLVVCQPKNWSSRDRPRVLCFSAAATGLLQSNNALIGTPKEINAKFMWYPPIPDMHELSELLKRASVYLSADSLQFLILFCAGRRGVFMHALKWVQDSQNGRDQVWDYQDTLSQVKESLEQSRQIRGGGWDVGLRGHLKLSRAVRVNGPYGDMTNIPREFAEVLYGGSKFASELNGKERELTIAGFLVPERTEGDQEFVTCDWTETTTARFGISNSIMAQYYYDAFGFQGLSAELTPEKKTPSSTADLTARFLPYLSLANVVDNSIPDEDGKLQSSSNHLHMLYENHYNEAISAVLKKLNFTVANARGGRGKTDIVVILKKDNDAYENCASETVLASRGAPFLQEHASRFFKEGKTNYTGAKHKGLLIVDGNKSRVERAIVAARAFIDKKYPNDRDNVEVIGLVHSSMYDGYYMILEEISAPLFFNCDHVAKALERNGNRVEIAPAQRLTLKRKLDDHE